MRQRKLVLKDGEMEKIVRKLKNRKY